ncbi:unnamed protein product [Lasius platythorax]|uniref:Uncharacterized protein n=1 Tax=Lasius platythorax TaxID=488582 RepID=A0AAV2P0J8_9HYME
MLRCYLLQTCRLYVVYHIGCSYHIVAHNIMPSDPAAIKTFLLTFLRQESRSKAREALLEKKTSSLERPPIANITLEASNGSHYRG